MSGYKNFAIVGAGTLGKYIVQQFQKEKNAGTVNEVVVLTRQVKYRANIRRTWMVNAVLNGCVYRAPRPQSKATLR